ncbi:glucosamine-6-phosphate deaminase [Mycoplasmopsis pulmonis]|uniref:glucosamine-6-phosphate deaminase n=1 Tax=Mycoplasmopsis pulmonis TaxID=2107 RepID=UPI001004D98E|nr:glucosamine-6-phosphate deaminase [Mycoplasmopsis pulmonis]MDZ7293319.1 glucosamine-6-phosphate deaminase [Mycoplasmopsis pulmonis]VEU68124.1 Glucosamine-6-phosphate isomerase [Mycoplasmopsis pulmonis]
MREIYIFKDLQDLHKFCAKQIIDQIKIKKDSTLGFATGKTPLKTYQLLVKDHQENKTSWKDITSFNLDEFVDIDPSHPESFIKQMKSNLFDHLDINEQKINIPKSNSSNPDQEALNYENKIRKNNGIDLQFISIGVNGHIAYNEPGTPKDSLTHVSNLTKETILDLIAKNKFSSIDEVPKKAITMGVKTILNQCKKIMMVSFGKEKAQVTKQMLEDKPNENVTASFLQEHPNCIYILDKEAASLLNEETLKKAKWI